jgi:hypothetical protein
VIQPIESGAATISAAIEVASDPQAAEVVRPRTLSRSRAIVEWLLRTRALTAARAALPPSGSPADEFHRRARLAYELAERALDPIEPLRAGSSAVLAAELFGQSAYWAVCAVDQTARAIPPSQVWSSEIESELARSLADRESLHAAGRLLPEASFVSLAELSGEEQLQSALGARLLASVALDRAEQPRRRVATLRWQRFLRLGVCALVLLAVVAVSVRGVRDLRLGPDLAAGKPWKTSSTWRRCDPVAGRCGSVRTRIFFHTKEDASPWIEYDLGAPGDFSRVVVRNRTDSAPDRAIPLLIEVSDDKKVYREVARRTTAFRVWRAEFPRQRARHVRLRVPRRSWLHLEGVSIYGPE